jgi:hypothetical protein
LSTKVLVPNGYVLERLDTQRHSRKEFGCGKEALDTFLRTQASQAQGRFASATHVLIETPSSGNPPFLIAGYVTLVSTDIPLIDVPPTFKRISTKPQLPTLLLARMAVDQQHKGKRLGEFLLKYTLEVAWQQNQNSGCFLVVVDAKDQDAKDFYLKYGFAGLTDNSMRLFMPMVEIEKLFSN